jgi:hypothetical protein
MWILVTRSPPPDAPYWPGRCWLAAVDAALWPLLWAMLLNHAPKPVGLVGPVCAAVALLCALNRLHRALWANHRYQFTTWRWGKVAAAMLLMGAVLKVMLPA